MMRKLVAVAALVTTTTLAGCAADTTTPDPDPSTSPVATPGADDAKVPAVESDQLETKVPWRCIPQPFPLCGGGSVLRCEILWNGCRRCTCSD